MGNTSARETWKSSTNDDFNINKNEEEENFTQEFPIKLKSPNKIFIFFPLVLILMIVASQVWNFFVNEKLK